MRLTRMNPSYVKTGVNKRCQKGAMEITSLTEPFFILRFWLPKGDTSRGGHVSFAQDDGTYISGHWVNGVFEKSKSLWDDVERMGSHPTLTLRLFYHNLLPNVGAIKVWLRNALIGQTMDPEVTCSSLVYTILQKGGSSLCETKPDNLSPVVLREIIFQLIREQESE